jgi:trk system potassium uptake protein TrkH
MMKGIYSKVLSNGEFKTYITITALFTLIIALFLYFELNKTAEESFRLSLFNVVSVLTTTGYATDNYTQWLPFVTSLFLLLMFTGGSAGSTAGGVKIVRHIIILKNAYTEFLRLLHPRAIVPVRFNRSAVGQNIVYNVLAFFFLYILSFVFGVLVISMFGYDLMTCVGASIACLGNIGPGIGGVDPSHNFAFFSEPAQLFLSFLMLLGRLELFTVFMIFLPAFWRKA